MRYMGSGIRGVGLGIREDGIQDHRGWVRNWIQDLEQQTTQSESAGITLLCSQWSYDVNILGSTR